MDPLPQARVGHRHAGARGQADREPAEPDGEQQEHEQAEPEGRQRSEDVADRADQPVGPAVAVLARDDAERPAEQARDDPGRGEQHERVGQALGDHLGDRALQHERGAQVSVQGVAPPQDELLDGRPVEAPLGRQGRVLARVDGALGAQVGVDRVHRRGLGEEEGQGAHREDQRGALEDLLQRVARRSDETGAASGGGSGGPGGDRAHAETPHEPRLWMTWRKWSWGCTRWVPMSRPSRTK